MLTEAQEDSLKSAASAAIFLVFFAYSPIAGNAQLIVHASRLAAAKAPVISPSVPVVKQGAKVSFGCISNCGSGGKWACIHCAGTIDSATGIYTAPRTVKPQQTSGGYQLLPNNHIYNVNIASLPVNSNNSTMINKLGGNPVRFEVGWPINHIDNSTPSQTMSFWYPNQPGSPYNGPFQIPHYPYARIETGWLSATTYNPFQADHHFVTINTQTGQIQEMYQYYPAGTEVKFNQDSCSSCNSRSGVKYNYSDYALPGYYKGSIQVGATDAAGLQIWPLTLRLQEVENAAAGCPNNPGVVNHALRFTTNLGALNGSFIWPATATIAVSGGANYFGERLRLKSSFKISGYSCIAQVILKTLQQYGMFLADVGTSQAIQVEYTRWPYACAQALGAIGNGNITPSHFDVVDESTLEVNAKSGLANTGREIVTYTSSTGTASVDVALMAAAVTVDKDIVYFQAGAHQTQLVAYSNLGSVTWSMNPSIGTLTTGGLYAPPSNTTTPSATTVTATSTADPSVSAVMTLVVFPSDSIYLVPGRASNYTDVNGHVWFAGPLYGGGDAANTFTTLSAFGYGNGGFWPRISDISLYTTPVYAGNDIRFDLYVENGSYAIDAKFANNSTSDQGNFVIEAQGVAQPSPIDVYTLVGSNHPYDFTKDVTVTDGLLSFVVRNVNTTGNHVAPFISALKIAHVHAAPSQSPR